MGLTNNLGKLSNMITSTGSAVGIGTISPSANLQLSGYTSGLPASSGSAQRGAFRIANSSNIAFDFGTVAAGQAWIQVSDVNNYASNFALLLNPNGGNVGIGTTSSPSYILDVQVGGTATQRLRNNAAGGTATLLLETANTFSGTSQAYVQCIGTAGGGQSQLVFATAGSSGDSSATERMRITSAGNVGIGTSSPTGQLSIANQISNGSNPVSSYAATSGVNGQNFFNGYYAVNSDGLGTFPRYLDIVSVGSPDGSNGGSNIRFFTNPIATSSPAVERMRISSSGAITTPSQPAFRAYYSVNGFWNLNTNDLFNFDSTEYNIGSCFNTSNGSFTAPVAGVYQFNFYAIVYGAITNGAIAFRRNGVPPTSGHNVHFSPTQAGAWSNVVYTTSIYLSAGDYVQMYNTGGYTQYHGKDWSSFSGYLVG